jgi:hypothetical protein
MALMNDPGLWLSYYFPDYSVKFGYVMVPMDEVDVDTIDIDYEEIKPLELPEAKIPGHSPGH